eukprot:5761946-Pleurochrysis_carterae.AAC.2
MSTLLSTTDYEVPSTFAWSADFERRCSVRNTPPKLVCKGEASAFVSICAPTIEGQFEMCHQRVLDRPRMA